MHRIVFIASAAQSRCRRSISNGLFLRAAVVPHTLACEYERHLRHLLKIPLLDKKCKLFKKATIFNQIHHFEFF